MTKTKKLYETLNEVFSNPNFIREIATSSSESFQEDITIVLKYYVATRDINTNLSLKKIKRLYAKFLDEHIGEAVDNTIKHGFLTHSFNGYKKERVIAFGLDYEENSELKEEIDYGRRILNELEELLGKSFYTTNEEKERKKAEKKPLSLNDKEEKTLKLGNTIYMTALGEVGVEYALLTSPERLYQGPLYGSDTPLIIGETKAQHYYKLLEQKLSRKYKKSDLEKYKKGIKLAKEVVNYFCTKRPCIALIEIDKILDVPFFHETISKDAYVTMQDVVSDPVYNSPSIDSLTRFYGDNSRDTDNYWYKLYDLVTYSSNIPKEAVGIFELADFFELFQLNAREKGFKIGTKFKYFDGVTKDTRSNTELATIREMKSIVDNLSSIDDLEELESQVAERKNLILSELAKYKNKLLEFGVEFETDQELRKIYADLEQKEESLFNKPYQLRDGINPQKSLKDIISNLKKSGKFDSILERDNFLKNDKYQSTITDYDVNHTRRVVFILNYIAKQRCLNEYERRLLLYICLNYNIGRKNGVEEKKQGELSVSKIMELMRQGKNRLQNLDEKEEAIVKFIITQYSLSDEENAESIKQLGEIEDEQRKKYRVFSALKRANLQNKNVIEFNEERFQFDLKNIKTSEFQELMSAAEKEYSEISRKFPMHVVRNYQNIPEIEKLLKCFKDGIELDKVRFSPDGSDLEEGLNSERLNFDSSKELEGLAYECFDKLVEILDIEHTKKAIEYYLRISEKYQRELKEEPKIQAQIKRQKRKCRKTNSIHMGNLENRSVKEVSVQTLPENIQQVFGDGGRITNIDNKEEHKSKPKRLNDSNDTQSK